MENRVCPHCGKEIKEATIFCPHCGEKIPAVTMDEVDENIIQDINALEKADSGQRAEAKRRTEERAAEPTKKTNPWLIILLLIVVFFIGILLSVQ